MYEVGKYDGPADIQPDDVTDSHWDDACKNFKERDQSTHNAYTKED